MLIIIPLVLFVSAQARDLPRVLILTGNGNLPTYREGYPPWIHEFQNEKVIDILRNTAIVDTTQDLSVLTADRLSAYDLVISNSIFLEPNAGQLKALYDFVANGKSYFTIHCGLLSLLNWDRYEEFIGGIFIGGPSTVPPRFRVVTSNVEFWGYQYSFRKNKDEHPVSKVVDDFETKDELYYFQPSTPDFHVIARAENLPIMWWHPVGKGKVMTLTLGHDLEAKNNPGYQQLLQNGVKWLTGAPVIHGIPPKLISTRRLHYKNIMSLKALGTNTPEEIEFKLEKNHNPELFVAETSTDGKISLQLKGKPGTGQFTVSARKRGGYISYRTYEIKIEEDGHGNIAAYHGNSAKASSFENATLFDAVNVMDGDPSTRWSSAAVDTTWISLDLQKNYPLRKIVLHWEASYAKAYSVETSTDGKSWSKLIMVTAGDGEKDVFEFETKTCRYIRIVGTKRASSRWGYSLYEVELYQ